MAKAKVFPHKKHTMRNLMYLGFRNADNLTVAS